MLTLGSLFLGRNLLLDRWFCRGILYCRSWFSWLVETIEPVQGLILCLLRTALRWSPARHIPERKQTLGLGLILPFWESHLELEVWKWAASHYFSSLRRLLGPVPTDKDQLEANCLQLHPLSVSHCLCIEFLLLPLRCYIFLPSVNCCFSNDCVELLVCKFIFHQGTLLALCVVL